MKMHSAPVKSKVNGVTTQVGTANYPQYDSVDEARQSISEDVLLSVINVQVKTNAMNKIRQEAVGGPTKKELHNKAMAWLAKNDVEALVAASVQGDEAVAALVDATVEKLREEAEASKLARLQAAGATVTAPSDDDDEDQE
jgi:hypothetical protein